MPAGLGETSPADFECGDDVAGRRVTPSRYLVRVEGNALDGKATMFDPEWDDDAGANDEGHDDGPQPYHGKAYREAEYDRRAMWSEDRDAWGY